jgi:ribosomal protein S27E
VGNGASRIHATSCSECSNITLLSRRCLGFKIDDIEEWPLVLDVKVFWKISHDGRGCVGVGNTLLHLMAHEKNLLNRTEHEIHLRHREKKGKFLRVLCIRV